MEGIFLLRKIVHYCLLGFCLFCISCSTLPQKVSRHINQKEYSQARQLLEKEGAGEHVRKDATQEALEARGIFAERIQDLYLREASMLADSGSIRTALIKVEEGLAISPWSDGLLRKKDELNNRIERLNRLAGKWRISPPTSGMTIADARALLYDLKQIGSDYADTPSLITLHDIAVLSVVGEWENRIMGKENPIPSEKFFWADMESIGWDEAKSDNCISSMVSLSSNNSPRETFKLSENRDTLFKAASCSGEENFEGQRSQLLRLKKASKSWVSAWLKDYITFIGNHELSSFDNITEYESLASIISPSLSPELQRQIGLLHLRAAGSRSGSGVSAVISLLHAERAQQLLKNTPSDQARSLQKRAVASILAGERLVALMAIDSDPTINPQLYDFVRRAFMVAIRNRTKGYFYWNFLPPGQGYPSEEIIIDSITFDIPSESDLNTIVSEYYSHTESVPNPYKSYLEGMLSSAQIDLNFAKSAYNSAVSSHNIYPTQYSLMNVNNSYNTYIFKLNTYNNYVSLYNATPSTIERPVYIPYSFMEGRVKYGWEVQIRYKIEGQSGTCAGKSMESDFVRIGTKYNDKNPNYRRDDNLSFQVNIEKTIDHLFTAVNAVCEQMKTAISETLPLKYTSGLSDSEIKTAKWFLHPWGADNDVGRKNGVPEWILLSASSIKLPDLEYKPPKVILSPLLNRPKLPLSSSIAAKWYEGLTGEIIAVRRGKGQAISTGAVISADGMILTCAHGISGEDLQIKFRGGVWAGSYPVEIVFVNEKSDVALIRAKGLKTNRWMEVRLDSNSKKGEEIIAIGNPTLPDGSQSLDAISKGIISNTDSDFQGTPRTVADIAVASGSSGGPIISLADGKIVGVVVAVADSVIGREPGQRSASGTVCLAAPANKFKEWLGMENRHE